MKKIFLSLLVALLPLVASAHDFEVDGIYYKITSSAKLTVEVTYRGSSYDEYEDEYTGKVVIPESVIYNDKTYSVTSIGSYAFCYCSGLTSIAIPNSVTRIGSYAFYYCSGLTSIVIPNSVTSIGSDAFSSCEKLSSVTIGNSVTSIGRYAFYKCKGLTSVTIGNSVTSIGERAFSKCSGLTSIEIPNSVTSIGSFAFYGCSGLTSVTIGNSVTSIGEHAFYGCSGLTSIEIPNSVTSIGSSAFCECSGLTSVTIGNSVTSIGESAFFNCRKLTSVEIPNSVTSIGGAAFRQCSGLTSVEIPNSVTSIGSTAFCDCTGLTSVTIGNSVTSIGSSAFFNCRKLTSVEIPNSVTSIGERAFFKCSGLTSIEIPNSVTSIGESVFANCAEISNVYCLAEKVPSTKSSAFENSYIEYATLHVPASSVEKYKTTSPWSEFGKIKTLTGEDVEVKTCATPTITYQNGKLVFGCETEGAVCHSTITDSDIASYTTNEIELTATYNISVYATKNGYKDSEVAKATLCWIDVEPKTEGVVETGISNVKALPVMVQVNGDMLTVSGANDGTKVEVFTIAGAKVCSAVTSANTATVNVSQLTDNVIIVKVGSKAIKVTVK